MKQITTSLLLLLTTTVAFGQYKPASGSQVQFKIKNLGFTVTGSFTGLEGSIYFDPAKPAEASFDVSVNAGTVNTDNTMRDNHLRKETYFNVTAYPRIRFVSTAVTAASGKDKWMIQGRLTIKNHSKEIRFPFTAARSASGDGYQFKGSFTLNRKDFDMGGTSTISDNLEILLNILADK